MNTILIKPVVTEKMTSLSGDKFAESGFRYAFVVRKDANKVQIKNAVEKQYGVTVESVNTMVNNGKIKTRNTRKGIVKGRVKRFKKAVVTLKKGETIDFFAGI
ncbi:MAG: 50S ribosomal protein L23 [Bacteroidota bacterium]